MPCGARRLAGRRPGAGQDKLAGTWAFDWAKSDPAPLQAGRGGRGVAPGVAATLTIHRRQASSPSKDGRRASISAVYKLDGSQSTNTLGDIFLSRSKVTWEGPKLVITTIKDMGQGPNGMMSEDSKEVYSMDGGVLTIVATTRTTPSASGREQTRKLVYNRRS